MPVILTAGTVGRVTDTTAMAVLVGDVQAYTDWTTGRLVFDNVPASVLLATVGRWYGYEFRYSDSTLNTRHFRAIFNVTAREETLAAVASLLNVTMTFDGKTVTLHPRTMHRSAVPPVRQDRGALLPSSEVGK